jgi:hypothetical protein
MAFPLLYEQKIKRFLQQRLHAGLLLRRQDFQVLGNFWRKVATNQALARPGRAIVVAG